MCLFFSRQTVFLFVFLTGSPILIDSVESIDTHLEKILADLTSRSKQILFRGKKQRYESSSAQKMCKFPLPFHLPDGSRDQAIRKWKDWISKKFVDEKGRVTAVALLSGSGNGKSHFIDYIQKTHGKENDIELVTISANDEMSVCSKDRPCIDEKQYLGPVAVRMIFSYFVEIRDNKNYVEPARMKKLDGVDKAAMIHQKSKPSSIFFFLSNFVMHYTAAIIN